jgi:hypothetical protein
VCHTHYFPCNSSTVMLHPSYPLPPASVGCEGTQCEHGPLLARIITCTKQRILQLFVKGKTNILTMCSHLDVKILISKLFQINNLMIAENLNICKYYIQIEILLLSNGSKNGSKWLSNLFCVRFILLHCCLWVFLKHALFYPNSHIA